MNIRQFLVGFTATVISHKDDKLTVLHNGKHHVVMQESDDASLGSTYVPFYPVLQHGKRQQAADGSADLISRLKKAVIHQYGKRNKIGDRDRALLEVKIQIADIEPYHHQPFERKNDGFDHMVVLFHHSPAMIAVEPVLSLIETKTPKPESKTKKEPKASAPKAIKVIDKAIVQPVAAPVVEKPVLAPVRLAEPVIIPSDPAPLTHDGWE